LFKLKRQGFRYVRKQRGTAKVDIIRQTEDYLFWGIACFMLSLGLAFVMLFFKATQDELQVAIMIVVFMFPTAILGIFFIILYINWKIEIGVNEFTFTNIFRRKRTYLYKDVKIYQLEDCTKFYYNNKCIAVISKEQENFNALENAVFEYQLVEINKSKEELRGKGKISKNKKRK
jgi:hypothetical protein